MAIQRTDAQAWKETQQFCKDYNMFISEKGGKYHLYRKMPNRPVYLGSRGSVEGIRSLVEKCAGSKQEKAAA